MAYSRTTALITSGWFSNSLNVDVRLIAHPEFEHMNKPSIMRIDIS